MPEEDVAAVIECLESGWLTMGPRTQAFERALEESTGASHAVAVSSGTAALHLACLAAGLGPGRRSGFARLHLRGQRKRRALHRRHAGVL